MFTIKLVHKGGNTEVMACESYSKTPINGSQLPTLTMTSRGEKEVIELVPGDTVFVENATGRTVDVIRTFQKAPA